MPNVDASQGRSLATVRARSSNMLMPQGSTLGAINVPAEQIQSSSAFINAAQSNEAEMRLAQGYVLAAVKTPSYPRDLIAWEFTQDGHHFYVIQLGSSGTLVYDTLTKRWAEWDTDPFGLWLARHGVNWDKAAHPADTSTAIATSMVDGIIYHVSADLDGDTIRGETTRAIIVDVSGIWPMRMRDTIACDEVMLTTSVGMGADVTVDPRVRLRSSDDNGVSWTDWGTLALAEATQKTQVTWQSLGLISAPGRIFNITMVGGARRIAGLDMYSRDLSE